MRPDIDIVHDHASRMMYAEMETEIGGGQPPGRVSDSCVPRRIGSPRKLALGLALAAGFAIAAPPGFGQQGGVAEPAPLPPPSPAVEHPGAAALGLGLRSLGTTKRVLMIAAHPDDEDTSLLAALALGEGAQVAYLSLTRGEGGQNGIGPELQEALGLIRSEELLAARRLDGAVQFFTRAYDFGYSRTLDETLRHWPREELLADVVAVVRAWRPDIVLSVFSGTPRDGHGQHQAAGVMAQEAFESAGDPDRFPEQIAAGLLPHAPLKLYRSSWFRPEEATLRLPTGTYDPLLGRSHFQVAMASRSRHRSQDMGRLQTPGPRWGYVQRLAARAGPADAEAETSIWEGVDTTLTARVRALAATVGDETATSGSGASAARALASLLAGYESRAAALRDSFNPLQPGRLVPELARGLAELRAADSLLAELPGSLTADLRLQLAARRQQAALALGRAAGIELDVLADTDRVVPGQPFELELTLWNGGADAVELSALAPALPEAWSVEEIEAETDEAPPAAGWGRAEPGTMLLPGGAGRARYRVVPPADAAPTEPYFLRAPRAGSMYDWPDTVLLGTPFDPRPVRASVVVAAGGEEVRLEREAAHRSLDPRSGELRRPVRVVPAVTVALEPLVRALPLVPTAPAGGPAPIPVEARVGGVSNAAVRGTLRLHAPAGWSVEPSAIELEIGSGAERNVELVLRPAPDAAPGAYRLGAVFEAEDGRTYRRGYEMIDYDHIRPQPIYRDAVAEIVAFEAEVPAGLRVGYVLGAADRVPAALAQLGIDVVLLDEAALSGAELGDFDAIVVGPRAYEVRPDLVAHNGRLLDYASAGGTLIVQYQQYAFVQGGYAPHPLSIARPHDRVTDHESPVRLLEPEHRAFTFPNVISAPDFNGWVQERGLYFARDWDEAYSPLLELEDPGLPPVRGGLLVAPYGEGAYVYTGLAFFRQLPAGVPGAYRLFLNLLSLGIQ